MIKSKRNTQILSFGFVLFIITFFIVYQNREDLSTFKDPLVVSLFRNCSNAAYYKSENVDKFILSHQKCVEKYISKKLKLDQFNMGRHGESKYFLPLKNSFNQELCNWITVGVGGDILVEKMFKEKYPGCSVFGVEPSPDQHQGFEQYGTVIPYGVGVTNGTFELTLREGEIYVKKQVPVFSMPDLLDKYLKTRTVLYMTIDIEGFEYSILEELLEGKILYNQGIRFCQIDAELHGFNDTKVKTKPLLHNFDSPSSPYLPVFSKKFHVHRKITFVNFKDVYCQKAFNLLPIFEE